MLHRVCVRHGIPTTYHLRPKTSAVGIATRKTKEMLCCRLSYPCSGRVLPSLQTANLHLGKHIEKSEKIAGIFLLVSSLAVIFLWILAVA
jgi:hypothetical protein